MQRRTFVSQGLALAGLGALGTVSREAWAANVSEGDAVSGVRAALERGAVAAIGQLGKTDGFLGNPKVRIPLPGFLEDISGILRATGQKKRLDELVTAMNRAAEAAMPDAKALLVQSVKDMSVEDARNIITGGDDSVTRFFAGKTREPLTVRFLPVMTRATQKVALAEKYNAVAGKAANMGLLKKGDANIETYVTGKALDGLYLMIAEEERKIRKDPLGTGSAILQKVFGALK